MADLQQILQRSKAVLNKTQNLPYGGYVEKKGGIISESGEVSFSSANQNTPLQFNESVASKSKLPQEIINAMRESSSTPTSVLDSVSFPNTLIEENIKKETSTVMNANTLRQETSPQSIVDYGLIKTIMEDTVKKYVGSLKKTMLSEEKNGGLQMMTKKGNVFRFITEDGKVFEGKLTYKGNIND